MKHFLKCLLIAGFCLTASACGYQFEGGGYVEDDIRQVAVATLENMSSESGAGVVFTSALIREILEKTKTRVVDPDQAEAVFTGRVKSITFHTLSRTTSESVVERRVQAVVNLKLVSKDGRLLWSVRDYSATDDYTVSEDRITDDSNRREAVEKVAERCAEKLISQTLVDF